ncbi:MAG: ABC transporter substrate-binding protein [Albimonas sp.]|uniref:ABC transporter substrate-binding protein n=1 Tax=Albimonas sp. TaxID=1872425 RepID=UPI004057752F
MVSIKAGLRGGAIAAALAAGGAAQAADLVWARYGDADSLDPHRATSTLSMQVWDQIYDTLLAFDMEGTPGPNMAESWEVSDDGLTYTFKLAEGIKCHDGSDFTAQDVKFTIDRAFGDNPSLTRTSWGPITEVTVEDPLTFTVAMSSKFGAFLPFLADSFSSMLCDTNTAETFGSSTAIGTGPFKLVEWVKGDQVTLEKNPDFVNRGDPVENPGAPYIDRLIIRTVPEAQTRLAALTTGEVHIAEPPFDDVAAIQEEGELEIMVAENTGQDVFWEFTTSRPPFDDIRARQAVAYATDPQMAIDIIYGGLTNREWCPVARGVFGNDQEFCKQYGYPYDPEKAQALLAEMGYGPDNPLETTMFVWTGGNRHKLAEIFQAQLAQVGIQAGIEIMDIGTMNARVKAQNEDATSEEPGTFDMMTWSWYDPDILYQLWHSPGAYSGFSTPELDAMLEETRTTIEPEARLEKVQAVIRYLMENAVHIGLYSPGWEWVFAVRPEVSGFKIGPFLHPIFTDVKIDG